MRVLRTVFFSVLFMAFPLAASAGPVNINTADAKTLSHELTGIGSAKAAQIVAYRKLHGPFKSADDLVQIKGIGKATVDKNRKFIRVEDSKKG